MGAVETVGVAQDEAGLRVDRWFRRHYPNLAHGKLEKLLRTGQVRVDGRRVKGSDRLEAGQRVRVPPLPADPSPAAVNRPPRLDESLVETLRAAVLYRDPDVLALNKPPGLAVQGGTATPRHLDVYLDTLRFEGAERPRLVHRLDKDTSGVLVLGRSAFAANKLAQAFRARAAAKIYWAVTVGVPTPLAGTIDAPLAKAAGIRGERMAEDDEEGVRAITRYRVVEAARGSAAWLALRPFTGRTHQLRVHCTVLETPILGDGKYGGARAHIAGTDLPRRLHLHARRLVLDHPRTGVIDVTAPLPPHMKETWRWFGFEEGAAGRDEPLLGQL